MRPSCSARSAYGPGCAAAAASYYVQAGEGVCIGVAEGRSEFYGHCKSINQAGFRLTMNRIGATATVERVMVSAYQVPTDKPESDGTLAWDSTTLVLVEITAGG